MTLAVEHVGDAGRVGAEQAVVEVALVAGAADRSVLRARSGRRARGRHAAAVGVAARGAPAAGGLVAHGDVGEDPAVGVERRAVVGRPAAPDGRSSWKSPSSSNAPSCPSAPSLPSTSRPTWMQPTPRVVLKTRMPHGGPPTGSGVAIGSSRTGPPCERPEFRARRVGVPRGLTARVRQTGSHRPPRAPPAATDQKQRDDEHETDATRTRRRRTRGRRGKRGLLREDPLPQRARAPSSSTPSCRAPGRRRRVAPPGHLSLGLTAVTSLPGGCSIKLVSCARERTREPAPGAVQAHGERAGAAAHRA